MRAAMLIMTATLAACAGQTTAPAPQPVIVAAAPIASPPAATAEPVAATPYVAANGGVTPTLDIDSQRRAAAKNLNLKVVNKDGQQLYCRSNLMTGSHIQRDTRCYTAQQLDKMEDQAQRDFKEFWTKPNYGSPNTMPASR